MWWPALIGIALVGALARIAYVLVVVEPVSPGLDAVWYLLQGANIREGTGYVVPTSVFRPPVTPTAGFPPAYPAYQSLWQQVAGSGVTAVRLSGIVPAAATILGVGALGRRVASATVGLVAAALVALSPALIAADGSGMSEVLTVPLVVGALLVGHLVLTSGASAPRILLLGALCGVAALTRQDLLLLVPLLALPVAVGTRAFGRLGRVGAGALVLVVVALLVVPWAGRNHRAVDSFTVSTLSPSSALAGANCDATYAGADLGSWRFSCVEEATPPPEVGATEVEVAEAQRQVATRHVRRHLGRLPRVVAARQARVWSLWDPTDLARRDADESRRYGWQLVARPVSAVATLVGVAGLVVLVRRRGPARDALILFVPVIVTGASAAASYGNPRFAAVAQPVLAIGAAVVLTQLAARWRRSVPRRGLGQERPAALGDR